MDIELAVDAMEIAPHIDRMVLFSGDGDFRSLVQAMQRRGVRVVVVSSMSTQPPMVAQELRRQADEFIDIKALQNKISRDPVKHPPRDRATSQWASVQSAPRSKPRSTNSTRTRPFGLGLASKGQVALDLCQNIGEMN